MKLQRVKCKSLSYAKEIFVSDSYIIACTGKKVNILDKHFNLLQTIEGLDYVYLAEMSPDEKELLLVSNENKFYVVNLETGVKRKVVVKSPYNYNIEGLGCWSFDGKYIYIVIMNSKDLLSKLRRYNAENLEVYEDFLAEEYVISKIYKTDKKDMYLLLGYSRNDEMEHLLFFDGNNYKEYMLEDTKQQSIYNLDLKEDYLLAYTQDECRMYSYDGKILGMLNHPNPKSKKLSFSEVFDFHELFDGMTIKALCEKFELEDINVVDGITKITESKNREFKYISSNSGFYVVDNKTGKCVIEHREEYGVQNFMEFEDGLILINAFGNVKLYRINKED